jgi:hypothetical protein
MRVTPVVHKKDVGALEIAVYYIPGMQIPVIGVEVERA